MSRPCRSRGVDVVARSGREGSTLLFALLILGTLSILATTAIVTSMGDRNLVRYDRHSLQALAAAETGIAFAKRAIVDRTASMTDYDGDGRPDFTLSDTLSWGGSYSVAAEASDIRGLGITAYQSNGFTIVSEGRFQGAVRRVKVEIVHDSFLKFARFVSNTSLTYGCGAILTGEVYTGQDLNVPCGCAAGREVQFLESVYAVGSIPNAPCATYHRGYVTSAEPIDLANSFNWTDIRNRARGLGADNSCERRGHIGIYINLPGTDPLGLAAQPAPDNGVLVFDHFDFYDLTTAPPDTVILYRGTPVTNTVTGLPMRRNEFNGLLVFEGHANVRGTMDGVSGRNVTIFGTNTVVVRNNIRTGHAGFDEVTRLPNGTGAPIKVGLVAENQIALHQNTPRVLTIDAALLSRTNNWRGLGSPADHPVAGPGPLDLDQDGIFGETPVNHDPDPGTGWDELNITAGTWVLNINGPIITNTGGDANPWNHSTVLAGSSGPTRRYNHDLEIVDHPPPCFPVPLNLWKDVSWTEILDVFSPLANHLPD